MEDTIGKIISALRTTTTRTKCTLQLRAVIEDSTIDKTAFTDALFRAVRSGSLPASKLTFWASITPDISSVIQCMRQQDIRGVSPAAIRSFAHALRHDETFDEAWAAIGGTAGLATFMDSLAVPFVFYMCRMLSKKGTRATAGRQKRQQACKDLLVMMCPDNEVAANKRPLRNAYHLLVLACDVETALAWDGRVRLRLRKVLRQAHGDAFLAKTLDACFPSSAAAKVSSDDFACLCALIQQDRSRYGLAALTRLAESETVPLGLEAEEVVDDLILPVIRRVPHKGGIKISRQESASLWKAITACFTKHPVLCTYLRELQEITDFVQYEFIVTQIVRDWGRFNGDADHEASLTTLLQLMPADNAANSSVDILLREAPLHLRYRLLRLFFQHVKGFGLDMGPLGENKMSVLETQRLRLTLETIVLLPPDDARLLAQRLLLSDPDCKWIASSLDNQYNGYGSKLLRTKRSEHDSAYGTYMLQALLHRVTGITSIISLEDELQRRRKLAQGSKSADNRGSWVMSALALSMATGNLDMYGATFNWSKRFARDPLVRHELCYRDIYDMEELVDLLCVVPPKSLLAFCVFDKVAFTTAVDKANRILVEYVQRAIDATQEPDFNVRDWHSTFERITLLVYERLQRVNVWQDHFSISDADVSELLWTPTLNTLIDAERQLLAFQNEDLCSAARRILYKDSKTALSRLRMPSCLFLDGLAKSRDSLWESYRVQLNPRVASLEAPWPRGLPLYETVGYAVDGPSTLAYMEERAKSILFGGSAVYSLPIDAVDSATKLGIGEFLESWPQALNIYIRGVQNEQRKLRIRSVWDHASGSLSRILGLSESHIRPFWLSYFDEAGAEITDISACDEDKIEILPSVDFPLSSPPPGWNPDNAPALLALIKNIPLKSVCLHFFLDRFNFSSIPNTLYSDTFRPQSYWDLARLQLNKNFSQPVIDGYICTAAFILNERYGSVPLFAEPFPSSRPTEVRFPAMSLDPDYTSDNYNVVQARSTLMQFSQHIPAALLARLVSSVLDNLLQLPDTAGHHANECLCDFVLVCRLLRRISPQAAADLAIKAVLELPPKISSWHRALLNAGLMKWLPPSKVEETLENLLQGFRLRFEAAELAKKDSASEGGAGTMRAAPVKITTIKLVARLLCDTNFVSPEYAVRLLTQLFRTSTHIDVHNAAAQALLSVAESLPDRTTAIQQQIIQALATYVVPRVGSLNEERWQAVPTEEEWLSMENRQEPLLELYDDEMFDEVAMLLHTLIHVSDRTKLGGNSDHPQLHSALLRLLESALCENGRLHKRWLKAFIVRENLAAWTQEIDMLLPAVPLCFQKELADVFSNGVVNADLFQAMSQHLLHVIEPPPALAAITSSIRADIHLCKSPAGRHWLYMWTNSSSFWDHNKTWTRIIGALISSTSTVEAPKFTDFVRDMAFAFLRTGDVSNLGRLTDILIYEERKALDKNSDSFKCGRGKGVALLRQLASETDRMRSQPSWRQNPDRQPAILPKAFEWEYRIWQCGVPLGEVQAEDQPHVLKGLVDRTVKIVSELVEDPGVPYHLEMQKFRDRFRDEGTRRRPFLEDFWIRLVIALGTVSVAGNHSRSDLITCLCADLSSSYLKGSITRNRKETDNLWGEATPQVNALLELWKESDKAFLWERAYDTMLGE